MLEDINYDDLPVVELLITGVDIVGLLPKVGIWKPWDNEPSSGIKTLWAGAKDAQKDIARDRGKGDYDKELWDLTIEEAESGGIRGPFTSAQLSELLGPRWIASRRFPVLQGTRVNEAGIEVPKIRPVDDFSEFGVNPCFGSSEKVSLYSIDQVVAWARVRQHATSDRYVSFTDTAGSKWQTTLHPEWVTKSWLKTVGRVADL